MPARPFVAWPLIALLAAAPAAAQDAPTDPEAGTDAAPETAPETAPATDGTAAGAPPAQATDAPTDAPAQEGLGAALSEDGDPQPGQVYVRDSFTDWELRCERTETGQDPCQLYQLLEDGEGNAVAEISVFALPENPQADAGATIITPLMTLLTEQLTLTVDGGEPRVYPFSWCSAIGCIARVGFTGEEVQAFRRGNRATLSIVPAAAPDQRVDLGISLSGFTAGFQAVEESGALVPAEE